jgi:hypothetical protein
MIGIAIFIGVARSQRVMNGPYDDSIPSVASDFFGLSVRFPETAAFTPEATPAQTASTSHQTASPDVGSPWVVVVLALIVVGVIGGTLVVLIYKRKYKRRIRPTASGQIDEHAADPLLVPDEFF